MAFMGAAPFFTAWLFLIRYRYHVITSLSDMHNDDLNVERRKMIERVVVGEFLVCMLKVYIQADSLLFAN